MAGPAVVAVLIGCAAATNVPAVVSVVGAAPWLRWASPNFVFPGLGRRVDADTHAEIGIVDDRGASVVAANIVARGSGVTVETVVECGRRRAGGMGDPVESSPTT